MIHRQLSVSVALLLGLAVPAAQAVSSSPAEQAEPTAASQRHGKAVATAKQTLKVQVLDRDGKPVEYASVDVINADDPEGFSDTISVKNGVGQMKVPAGTYSVSTQVQTKDAQGKNLIDSVVARYDIEVTDTGTAPSVVLDARTATVEPKVTTPRPATTKSMSFVLSWSGSGRGASAIYDTESGTKLLVSPQAAPKNAKAKLNTGVGWNLTGTEKSTEPYNYQLFFRWLDKGIPTDQNLKATNLATVHNSLYKQQAETEGELVWYLGAPWLNSGMANATTVPVGRSTTYLSADSGVSWSGGLYEQHGSSGEGILETHMAFRQFTAGSTSELLWNRSPLLIGANDNTAELGHGGSVSPAVSRTADKMDLAFRPLGSTQDQWIADFGDSAHMKVYRDGKLLQNVDKNFFASLTVPQGEATYRVVADQNLSSLGIARSAESQMDLTFRSEAGSGAALPSGWECEIEKGDCKIPSVLQAAVDLPVDANNAVKRARSTFDVTVDHIPGAAKSPASSATVEIKTAGGNWQTLSVQKVDDNTFRATMDMSSQTAGSTVDLRITGTDQAGGRIVQTVQKAFSVAAG